MNKKPKVLYIGNYNDGTGWGNAALNNILSMHSAGINVVPRSITYNNNKQCNNITISELEMSNNIMDVDVCIQHVLPQLYIYKNGMKNIGYYEIETLYIDSEIYNYLELMDEIWVANVDSHIACCGAGLLPSKVKIIPHSIDMDYITNHQSSLQIKELKNSFNFMFVGEFITRKNIKALLKAYYLGFDQRVQNVNLFLKLNGPTPNINYNIKLYNDMDQIVRDELHLDYYNNVSVMFDYLNKDDLLSVMKQCHAFVCPSYGESCCIPAMESLAMGIPSIWTSGIGIGDYGVGIPVNSTEEPCNHILSPISNLYNGRNQWRSIHIQELINAMQLMVKLKSDQKFLSEFETKRQEFINKYSIGAIGKKIKEVLHA
jgi:glycosyltransferase involved in cell wall biosynthesis